MKRKRSILWFIIIAILALPVLATGILQIGQSYIKSTREERLRTEDLVQVVIPATGVVWEEEGRELWVGDRMFDVASYTLENGSYYLTGVFDDDETEIAGTLLHLIFSKSNGHLLQLLLLLQCFTVCVVVLDFSLSGSRKRRNFSFNLFSFPSPSYMVLGPPPRQ